MTLKVPKRKVSIAVSLLGGEKISGNIFLGAQSAFHYGEEHIIDLLNDPSPFFPFEREDTSTIRLINKKNTITITTAEDSRPEEELGKKEKITLLLIDGQELTGEILIAQPEYRSRVLDTLNAEDKEFFRLVTDSDVTHYVNINHLSQVVPDKTENSGT